MDLTMKKINFTIFLLFSFFVLPLAFAQDDVESSYRDFENVVVSLDKAKNTDDYQRLLERLSRIDSKAWNTKQQAEFALTKGSLLVMLENYRDALVAYEQVYFSSAIETEKKNEIASNLSMLYMLEEDYDSAITVLRDYLVNVNDLSAPDWFRLGQSYYLNEQYLAAQVAVDKAITLVENMTGDRAKEDWYKYRAGILLNLGDSEAAALTIQENVRPQPNAETKRSVIKLITGTASDEFLPFIRSEPLYPSEIAERRIEGYVIVEFSVTSNGHVRNAFVTEAEPPDVFNESALRAVRTWQYKPRIVNGIPVSVDGVRSKLTFSIEK
ncbi:hypothetical protein NBRC116493_21840 [Aurantivibrio infirmus]